MQVQLSLEQKAIVEMPKRNVLVSAAAGSGKTFVLNQRILKRIKEGKLFLDELLLITFTNEAAADLRKKMLATLQEAQKEAVGKEKENIEKAIYSLPFSQISTIHAFCLQLLREFAYLLPSFDKKEDNFYDGAFKTLNTDLLQVLLERAVEESLQFFFENYPEELEWKNFEATTLEENVQLQAKSKAFYALLDNYGGRNQIQLKENLKSSFEKLRSFAFYREVLENMFEQRKKEAADLFSSGHIEKLLCDFFSLFEQKEKNFSLLRDDLNDETLAFHSKKEEHEASLALCRAYLYFFEDLQKENLFAYTYEKIKKEEKLSAKEQEEIWSFLCDFRQKLPEQIPTWDRRGKNTLKLRVIDLFEKNLEPLLSYFGFFERFSEKKKQEKIKKLPFSYRPLFLQELAPYQKALLEEIPLLEIYKELLQEIDARYFSFKQELKGIDFSDYEHLTLALLEKEEVQEYCKKRFTEIYVDEYQDTSAIQEEILRLIANENLFCVGDIKQSIYRFREAKPALFLEKFHNYQKTSWEDVQEMQKSDAFAKKGHLLCMDRNFRSHKNLLAGINQIFYAIMQKEFSEIDYREGHALRPQRTEEKEKNLFLWVYEKEDPQDKKIEVKAEALQAQKRRDILQAIQDLHQKGQKLSEIAILAPKHTELDKMAKILETGGIPFLKEKKISFFNRFFVLQWEAFLQILLNPYQDLPLSVLLHGGLFFEPFSLNELAMLKYLCQTSGISSFHLLFEKLNEHLSLPAEALAFFTQEDFLALREKQANFQQRMEKYRQLSKELDFLSLFEILLEESRCLDRLGLLSATKEEVYLLTEEILETRNWLQSLSDQNLTLFDLIENIQEGRRLSFSLATEASRQQEAVSLLTYHASKGLEYEHVFLLGLDDSFQKRLSKEKKDFMVLDETFGFFTVFHKKNHPYDLERPSLSFPNLLYEEKLHLASRAENLRLLYVALTRAKDFLYLLGVDQLDQKAKNEAGLFLERSASDAALPTHLLHQGQTYFDFVLLALSNEDFQLTESSKKEAVWTIKRVLPQQIETEDLSEESEETWVDNSIYPWLLQEKESLRSFYEKIDEEVAEKRKKNLLPSKTTVTLLKNEKASLEEEGVSTENLEMQALVFEPLRYEKTEGPLHYTGAVLGTLYHQYFYYLPLCLDIDSVEKKLEHYVQAGFFTEEEKNVLLNKKENLEAFEKNELYPKMKAAEKNGQLFREMPFTMLYPHKNTQENLLVQGKIDLWFMYENKVYLLDYKSDKVKKDAKDKEIYQILDQRYRFQLECYAMALEKALQKKVDFVYIYHIPSQKVFAFSLEKE